MKHKKKIFAITMTVILVMTAYFFLPGIVKKTIINQAAKRGWNLTTEKVYVGWFQAYLKDVLVTNMDGTKQGKFDWVRIRLNKKLEPEEISVNGGSMSMTGPWKKSEGEGAKGKRVSLRIENVDARWKMSDENEIDAKKAFFELSDDSMKANAQSVIINSKFGQAEMETAFTSKDKGEFSASASKVIVSFRGTKTTLSEMTVNKLVVQQDHIEIEAGTKTASFPKDLSSSGVSAKLSIDLANTIKINFDIKSDSISGQHKSVSKEIVATSQMSTDGSFEAKTFEVDGHVLYDWDLRAKVKSGKASINIEIQRQRRDNKYNLWVFSAELESTPCQSVLEAIPEAMRTELEGVVFSGDMAGMFTVNTLEEKDNDPFVYVRLNHKCKVVAVPARLADAMAGRPFKRSIYTNSGIKEVTSGAGRAGWISFTSMSPYMAKAVVTTEDPGFWGHHGFDMEAIRNSLRENVKDRKFTRGASTIPMQLAKNAFLSRDKTATRKLQEFFLTIIVDQKMTKDRILEMYLNIVEFGPNLYGIGPASQHYFDTNPSQLSLGQSVFLSSILPRPRATYFNSDGALNEGKKNQVGLILDLMQRRGSITDEECKLAKEEVITFGNDKSDQSHKLDTSEWEVQ